MRDPIEPPHPRFRIRTRGAQDQAVREVGSEGQILIPGIGHGLEQLIALAANRGPRVEPGQEPLVEHPAIAAAHPDPGTRERGREPHADITELGERQGAAVPGAAVDDSAHPAAAPAPDTARDPILEEPARRPYAIEVRFQRLEVMAGEGGREAHGIGLGSQARHHRLQARFVLHEKLEHPSVGVLLGHGIGDQILQAPAKPGEVLGALAVGGGTKNSSRHSRRSFLG